jgi:hypothetical protein
MRTYLATAAAGLVLVWAAPSSAQSSVRGAPAPKPIDPATLTLPSLAFAPSADDAKDFDKYYYFHRDGTDFEAALADLRDCDGLARGLVSSLTYAQAPYPYAGTAAGALGGALGNALAAAIIGSAEKRAARRVNMRRCMFFKGYQRYGLPKDIWQKFNFEEGLSTEAEDKRQVYLAQQARVASGPKPATEGLGR